MEENGANDGLIQKAPHKGGTPKIWMVVFIGFVAISFAIIWLLVWQFLQEIIWSNEYVLNNHWLVPLLVIVLSLMVGLCVKYLKAPTALRGSLSESLQGGEQIDYRTFPGTLLTSFFSLLSGASIGPEGPLGVLVSEIATWFEVKLKLVKDTWFGYSAAALASAYNGLVGNPVFSAVFVTEVSPNKNLSFLIWNLLAGVIGFLVYMQLGLQSFMGAIQFPVIDQDNLIYIAYAIILGALGAFLAMFIVLWMKVFDKIMGRFREKVIQRILIASIIIAIVAYFVPQVMFSGEDQIHEIIDDSAEYGIWMLLLFALLKIILFSLSLKSGYLGGPIFPVLFTCTMIALALSLAFPSVPIVILVLCIEAAAISLALNAPLTAILLVTVVASTGTLNAYLIGLIVLATVVSIMIGAGVRRFMSDRARRKPALDVKSN